jgi:membrane-bound ClpP family serine protease
MRESKRFRLHRSRQLDYASPTEAMVGMRGTALTRLTPKGMVRIQGEIWEAASSNGVIEAGSEVIVLRTEGLEITVRKAERETQ